MASSKKGKAIASRNATKHGIFSRKPPTTDDQDYELFEQTREGLIAEFEPQTISEEIQVEQITMARVRLHRLWRAEAAMVQEQVAKARKQAIEPQAPDTLSDLLSELSPQAPEPIQEVKEELEKLAAILDCCNAQKKSIVSLDTSQLRLQREEGHLQRTIDRGLKFLQEQRDRRNGLSPKTLETIALE